MTEGSTTLVHTWEQKQSHLVKHTVWIIQ